MMQSYFLEGIRLANGDMLIIMSAHQEENPVLVIMPDGETIGEWVADFKSPEAAQLFIESLR